MCPSLPCFEYWLYLHFDSGLYSFVDCNSVVEKLKPYMEQYFPGSQSEHFTRVLKAQNYLQDSSWVKKLNEGRKMQNAVAHAEENFKKIKGNGTLSEQSYSLVFQMFKDG